MRKHFTLKELALLILIFSGVTIQVLGQTSKTPTGASKQAKPEDAKMIKDRVLLVGQFGHAASDERIKKLVKDFWKYSAEVKFLTNEEISSTIKNNETKYAILSINQVNVFTNSLNPGPANQFVRFSLKLGEKFNDTKPVFYQDVLPELEKDQFVLTGREIIFAIECIQNHLIARSEGKTRIFFTWEVIDNFGKLETKTLLVDEKILAKKFTKEEFKNNYPYPFEITNINRIEKALESRDKKYAYVELVPIGTSSGVLSHRVLDCENGQLISYGEFFNGAFDKYSNLVNDEQVKCYAKNSVDRKKNKKK